MTLSSTPSRAVVSASCLAVLLVCLSHSVQALTKCTWNADACGCDTDQGLISLKGMTTDPLQVKDGGTNSYYFWDPCKDFTMGDITASAIQNVIPSAYYDMGIAQSTTAELGSDGNALFSLRSADLVRTAKITCQCDSGTQLSYTSEDPELTYNLVLKSDFCCPGFHGYTSGGLSIGSILLITCLVLVCVYLIVGIGIQAGVRKAQGIERVPNLSFWSALPGLIKDGFVFTINRGQTGATYNKV